MRSEDDVLIMVPNSHFMFELNKDIFLEVYRKVPENGSVFENQKECIQYLLRQLVLYNFYLNAFKCDFMIK